MVNGLPCGDFNFSSSPLKIKLGASPLKTPPTKPEEHPARPAGRLTHPRPQRNAPKAKKTPTMSGQYGIPDWTTSSAPAPAVVEETSSTGWAASGGENVSAANNPNAGGVGNAPR